MSQDPMVSIRHAGMYAGIMLEKHNNKYLDKRAYSFIVKFNEAYTKFIRQLECTQINNPKEGPLFAYRFTEEEVEAFNLPEKVNSLSCGAAKELPYRAMERVFSKDLVDSIVVMPDITPIIKVNYWKFPIKKKAIVAFHIKLPDKELDWYIRHLLVLGSIQGISKTIGQQQFPSNKLRIFKDQSDELLDVYKKLELKKPIKAFDYEQ